MNSMLSYTTLCDFRLYHWWLASPWMTKVNPRDTNMSANGNDNYLPIGSIIYYSTATKIVSRCVFKIVYMVQKPIVFISKPKHLVRVLVCAPSNSALVEIVLRVQRSGIQSHIGHSILISFLCFSYITWQFNTYRRNYYKVTFENQELILKHKIQFWISKL